jgi:uncharacterized membrane protein
MDTAVQYLIYFHALMGTIALVGGMIAIVSRKGMRLHKKAGIIFVFSMTLAALSALIVAILPGHYNPFLFAMGIFSGYFLIIGYRALDYKRASHNFNTDKLISQIMAIVCLAMLTLPVLLQGNINIVLSIFGAFGLLSSLSTIHRLKNTENMRREWKTMHLGNITGAYIAAVSAFFVVNQILPGIYNWFAPSIVGIIFIAYWIRKVTTKSALQ